MRPSAAVTGRLALPLGTGLVLAAGQAPLSWPLPAFAALVVLLALGARSEGWRAAVLTGWLGGAGYFAGSLFWIVEPFLVDPVRHGWMAPFALVLLPGGLALFWALAFGLGQRFGQGAGALFLTAVLLAGVETARAWVFTGFPWALLGYMWIGAPPMQAAALVGPHGLTLATTLAAALAALAARPGAGRIAGPAAAALAVSGAWVWGLAELARPMPADRGVTLRIVQPNAEQSLKWDPDRAQEFMMRLLAGTAAAGKGAPPDLFIWPETAVPYLLDGSEHLLAQIDAVAAGRPVAFGIARRGAGRFYNSLVVTAPGGGVASIYDKHHLVPFGEYVPFGEALGRIGIRGMAASHGEGFSPGPGPAAIDFGPGIGRALALICYEAIFPQHLRLEPRPDWVLQITNDAWFGEVNGPFQHLAQARMRAVEQGLPVIRAANTGISAVIDARGRVLSRLGLGEQGFLDAPLPGALPPTPYARTGDLPALVAMLLLALALVAQGVANRIDPGRRGA